MKKGFVILLALIPVILFVMKVANVIETEQHNDRADFNNSVIRIVDELRDKVFSSQGYLLEFTQLEQLDESQQRGMWFLLEDMEFDYQEDIESARTELEAKLADADEEQTRYVSAAVAFVDSYTGYDDVYNELVATINARSLDSEALYVLLAEEFGALDESESLAIDTFEIARQNFINGG